LFSLGLQGRKRDLVFIAITIGELHVGLAWGIRVITSSKQIDPERRSRRSGLASGVDKTEKGELANLQRH
jgi:hypothetical protein